ncbi:conjugal transfer protein TrbF [Spirochaetia bacterium]|nr:conjugal transfer protein TrbF [Spirochaetia bacterium]
MNTEKTAWPLDNETTTPFNPLSEYDRIIGEQCRENKTWRRIALVSMTAFFLSLGIVFYALTRPATVPLVITVSDWGEAKYVGDVSHYSYAGIKVPEAAIQYQLRRFVTNVYSIPIDPAVLKTNIEECYASLTGSSAQKLSGRLREKNPFDSVGLTTVRVEIESVLGLAGKSYQVDFITTTSRPNETQMRRERMRGTLTVEMLTPDRDDLVLNPLGIYIAAFDFTKIGDL